LGNGHRFQYRNTCGDAGDAKPTILGLFAPMYNLAVLTQIEKDGLSGNFGAKNIDDIPQ
jgi:hypothetical protein